MRQMASARSRDLFRTSRLLAGTCALALSTTVASSTPGGPPRLPPQVPPHLDEAQQTLFDNIVDTRVAIVGRDALFDEHGALRGPWNPEVASPALGQHLERLATAIRTENSLEPRLYEVRRRRRRCGGSRRMNRVRMRRPPRPNRSDQRHGSRPRRRRGARARREVAILVVGVHWQAQFEWYAHEKIARRAGVADAAFPLMRAAAPADALEDVLAPDEAAVYRLALELMQTKRVSAATYAATKAALGGDGDRKMADLCMTMGCYSAVSKILNMFEVALPEGAPLPFPEPEK